MLVEREAHVLSDGEGVEERSGLEHHADAQPLLRLIPDQAHASSASDVHLPLAQRETEREEREAHGRALGGRAR